MAPRSRPGAVALVSAGSDSAVLLARLARDHPPVLPVYVRSGLLWERVELAALRHFLRAAHLPGVRPLRVVSMPVRDTYGRHWSVTGRRVPGSRSDDRRMYLPGRNLMLLTRGALVCAAERLGVLGIGTLGGNPFADASARFRGLMARAASLALGRRIRVVAPLSRMTKAEALRAGRRLPLHLTFTCAAPRRGHHCGRCNKCAERRRGFLAAGIPDRTKYGP